MTTPKYYNETVGVSIFVHEGTFHKCQIVLVCGCVSQFHDFSQDIRALPEAPHANGLLETLGEVYTNNFLIVK